jgi:16S rRNA (adenine1518-N6/adenine1519-N6)-dimethyltransferase
VVAALGDIGQEAVVEIGPGRGALTRLLARAAGHLTLLEFDPNLSGALLVEFAGTPTVDVRHADVLTADFNAMAQEQGRKLVVVGNLPYYITSDILLHLVDHHAAIDRAVLMVQREVAERITATPGTSDYGVLSATVQLYGEVELLFTLPPGAFAPPPEVYSSVFRFRVRPRWAELGVDPTRFIPFVRASFAQKRKTWANNLRAAGYKPSGVAAALANSGLDPAVRAEAVGLLEMAAAFHALHT